VFVCLLINWATCLKKFRVHGLLTPVYQTKMIIAVMAADLFYRCKHLCLPVVLKVVDIDPQGSIGPSKGPINSQGVEWGQ